MKLYLKVKDLLTKYPLLRDSDKKLTWKIWEMEGRITWINDHEVLSEVNYMHATSFETISRCRRKVQEHFPDLAGSLGVRKMKKIKQDTKGTYIYKEEFTGKLF